MKTIQPVLSLKRTLRVTTQTLHVAWLLFAASGSLVACGAAAGGTDSNTQWVVCERDNDCEGNGEAVSCVEQRCVDPESIATPGKPSTPETDAEPSAAGGSSNDSENAPALPQICEFGINCALLSCSTAQGIPQQVSVDSTTGATCCVCGADAASRPKCDSGEPLQLSGRELATRLSQFYWDSAPSPELIATAGEVTTTAGVGCLAREMLEDERASAGLAAFVNSWLRLDQVIAKEGSKFPLSEEFLQASPEETRLFVEKVVLEEEGTLRELLTANYTFAGPELKELYGLDVGESNAPELVELPAERPGLLTRSFFLASNSSALTSSPTLRGQELLGTLMCKSVPPPPASLEKTLPEVVTTTRAAYETLSATEPSCTACHQIMDPPGFAFEHFDAVGRYRSEENGLPIDAASTVLLDGGKTPALAFEDHRGLVEALASHDQVGDCFAKKLLAYHLGMPELAFGSESRAVLEANSYIVGRALTPTGYSLREALVALSETAVFLDP